MSGRKIHEIKLGDEFLMSSQFTDSEVALARLGLAEVEGSNLDVVVGGLGLGYTAWAAMQNVNVGSLCIVEYFAEVIQWHKEGLVPLGPELCADDRCKMVKGNFFELANGDGFDPERPEYCFDVVLLDIDHSPRHVLAPENTAFYTAEGLTQMARHLKPGGTFALWSNDPPDEEFLSILRSVSKTAQAHIIEFDGLHSGDKAVNSIYIAQMG